MAGYLLAPHDQLLLEVNVLAGGGHGFDFQGIASGLGLEADAGEHEPVLSAGMIERELVTQPCARSSIAAA